MSFYREAPSWKLIRCAVENALLAITYSYINASIQCKILFFIKFITVYLTVLWQLGMVEILLLLLLLLKMTTMVMMMTHILKNDCMESKHHFVWNSEAFFVMYIYNIQWFRMWSNSTEFWRTCFFDYAAHIFFDDAMELSEDGRQLPNGFVSTFMQCIDDAIRLLFFFFLFSLFFYTVLSQWEFIPWEIRVAFPQRKPAAKESRYPTLTN